MRYISLLRGINVSGQKSIKMAELKTLYEKLGLENVITYIQSGNVIFDTNNKSAADIIQSIENAISKQYGFDVPVLLRSRDELKKIIDKCPFKHIDYKQDGNKVLITIANTKPAKANIEVIQKFVKPPEELKVINREIYLYCPTGYGKSKLTNNFLEKKLSITASSRNIKTLLKLYELSG